jgi:hypothetical protein
MADERYKTVSMFVLPDEYQRQASEARRRRRMAEMLAQQAYQPGDIQNAPIPAAAPLVQGLQAYLTARAARKADEAEESARETASREARQLFRALTEEGDTTTNAVQPAMTPMAKTVTAPQFEDGRIIAPASIEMGAPPPMTAPETQLSRYNLTPGQRRAAALEGMLTSENPMLQKVAGAIYPTLQPEKAKLQTAAVNLKDLTPASARRFAASGDPQDIEYAVESGKAPPTVGGMMWDATQGKFVEIPGYAAQQGIIADRKRPDVVMTSGRDEPLQRIIGPDGKPVLVPRSQAIGKTPAPAPTNAPTMPPGIARDVASLRTRANQFRDSSKRANYFRNIIQTGQLPLDVASGVKYAAQRALDPNGTSRGSKGEKPAYVLYAELNRFVTEQVNTIMQLAKGTQTEGDALRAQKQILDNPNNAAVVLSAFEDLQRIFENAQKYAEEEADYLSKPYEASASNEVQEVDY